MGSVVFQGVDGDGVCRPLVTWLLANRSVILAQKLPAPLDKQIAENATIGGRSYHKMRLSLELL